MRRTISEKKQILDYFAAVDGPKFDFKKERIFFDFIHHSHDNLNEDAGNTLSQWVTRNPIDSNTWFVSFITYRSVQSVFPERF